MSKIDFWPFLKLQKMNFGQFKNCQKWQKREKSIEFFRILAHCDWVNIFTSSGGDGL
jgi:hypothetical protein